MKQAYIMRGAPGSGKSEVASDLCCGIWEMEGTDAGHIHTTDDYFMEAGKYNFDPTKLGEYHAKNLEAFTESCENGIQIVVCDNTNIYKEHYQPYIDAAKKNGYSVRIITVTGVTAEECFENNSHGVPMHAIEGMLKNL